MLWLHLPFCVGGLHQPHLPRWGEAHPLATQGHQLRTRGSRSRRWHPSTHLTPAMRHPCLDSRAHRLTCLAAPQSVDWCHEQGLRSCCSPERVQCASARKTQRIGTHDSALPLIVLTMQDEAGGVAAAAAAAAGTGGAGVEGGKAAGELLVRSCGEGGKDATARVVQ